MHSLLIASLLVGYFHRPPYYLRPEEGASHRGIVMEPAFKAFDEAGISYTLREMPVNRIIAKFATDESPFCSIGWLRTEEREKVSLLSKPIFRDQPFRVVIRAEEATRFSNVATLHELIASEEFCPGLAKSFSYGASIDPGVRNRQRTCNLADASHGNLLPMLVARRFDYLLVASEEIQGLLQASGVAPEQVKILQFDDAPKGNERHIMCTKNTGHEVINRIDAHIPPLSD